MKLQHVVLTGLLSVVAVAPMSVRAEDSMTTTSTTSMVTTDPLVVTGTLLPATVGGESYDLRTVDGKVYRVVVDQAALNREGILKDFSMAGEKEVTLVGIPSANDPMLLTVSEFNRGTASVTAPMTGTTGQPDASGSTTDKGTERTDKNEGSLDSGSTTGSGTDQHGTDKTPN